MPQVRLSGESRSPVQGFQTDRSPYTRCLSYYGLLSNRSSIPIHGRVLIRKGTQVFMRTDVREREEFRLALLVPRHSQHFLHGLESVLQLGD